MVERVTAAARGRKCRGIINANAGHLLVLLAGILICAYVHVGTALASGTLNMTQSTGNYGPRRLYQNPRADTLVVMIDSIKLKSMKSSDSSIYAIALNYLYAKRHNYDFAYIYVNKQQVIDAGAKVFNTTFTPQTGKLPTHSSNHDVDVGTFHPALKQFRATPWMKIPVLWSISVKGLQGKRYNKVLYLAMESVMNPSGGGRTLSDAYKAWSKPEVVVRGTTIKAASVVFFSNAPYYPRPYTDTLIMNGRRNHSADLFLHLWNANATSKNFAPFFERSVLWKAIEKHDRVIRATSYVHSEKQFPPCEANWICSMPNIFAKSRTSTFRSMYNNASDLFTGSGVSDYDLVAVLKTVQNNQTFEFDMIEAVNAMHRLRRPHWDYLGNSNGSHVTNGKYNTTTKGGNKSHSKSSRKKPEAVQKGNSTSMPVAPADLQWVSNEKNESTVLEEKGVLVTRNISGTILDSTVETQKRLITHEPASLYSRLSRLLHACLAFIFG
jgi:hypothetical protein